MASIKYGVCYNTTSGFADDITGWATCTGHRYGFPRVRVRVGIFPPTRNPYPRGGLRGLVWVFFFFTTNSQVVLTPPWAMAPLVCKSATSHLSHLLSSQSSIIMALLATACHTVISLKFSLAVSAGSHCLTIESSPCPTPLPVLAFWARVCHCSRPPIIDLFLDPGFLVQRALCDSDIILIPL